MAKSTVKTYMENTVDPLFSRYIRIKAAKAIDWDGWIQCVTCPTVKPWQDMDCGHYVGRQHKMTRFDERNVGPQCIPCNRFQEGNKPAFAVHLRGLYGDGIIEELDDLGRQIWLGSPKEKMAELKELAKKLRKELKELGDG